MRQPGAKYFSQDENTGPSLVQSVLKPTLHSYRDGDVYTLAGRPKERASYPIAWNLLNTDRERAYEV